MTAKGYIRETIEKLITIAGMAIDPSEQNGPVTKEHVVDALHHAELAIGTLDSLEPKTGVGQVLCTDGVIQDMNADDFSCPGCTACGKSPTGTGAMSREDIENLEMPKMHPSWSSPGAADIFERIYASEINFKVSTFWDAGFDWALGDEMNDYVAKGTIDDNIDDHSRDTPIMNRIAVQLANAAEKHYPESDFAKWWRKAIYYFVDVIPTGSVRELRGVSKTLTHEDKLGVFAEQAWRALVIDAGEVGPRRAQSEVDLALRLFDDFGFKATVLNNERRAEATYAIGHTPKLTDVKLRTTGRYQHDGVLPTEDAETHENIGAAGEPMFIVNTDEHGRRKLVEAPAEGLVCREAIERMIEEHNEHLDTIDSRTRQGVITANLISNALNGHRAVDDMDGLDIEAALLVLPTQALILVQKLETLDRALTNAHLGGKPTTVLNFKGLIKERQLTAFRNAWHKLMLGAGNDPGGVVIVNAEDVEALRIEPDGRVTELHRDVEMNDLDGYQLGIDTAQGGDLTALALLRERVIVDMPDRRETVWEVIWTQTFRAGDEGRINLGDIVRANVAAREEPSKAIAWAVDETLSGGTMEVSHDGDVAHINYPIELGHLAAQLCNDERVKLATNLSERLGVLHAIAHELHATATGLNRARLDGFVAAVSRTQRERGE